MPSTFNLTNTLLLFFHQWSALDLQSFSWLLAFVLVQSKYHLFIFFLCSFFFSLPFCFILFLILKLVRKISGVTWVSFSLFFSSYALQLPFSLFLKPHYSLFILYINAWIFVKKRLFLDNFFIGFFFLLFYFVFWIGLFLCEIFFSLFLRLNIDGINLEEIWATISLLFFTQVCCLGFVV